MKQFYNGKPYFLLYGANGWIGNHVYHLLVSMGFQVLKSNCRADNYDSVDLEMKSNPEITHVMSFIGRTHGIFEDTVISTIDYLEKPGKLVENINDNLYAPLILSSICKKYNKHFTYLGTGCIFDYDKTHPFGDESTGFKENDKPNFFGSSYSIVKGFTDRLMNDLFNYDVLNIRIRMPITQEINSRNFITKITQYKKICSIPNSMTVLEDLLPIMIQYALDFKTGTINLTNPGTITHNEILEMYKEIIDPNFTWENFSLNEQNNILLSKRSNNCLNTSTLESDYTNKVKPIKQAVRDILVKMKKNMELI
jgi:3,5-epimerase/4-reductase